VCHRDSAGLAPDYIGALFHTAGSILYLAAIFIATTVDLLLHNAQSIT